MYPNRSAISRFLMLSKTLDVYIDDILLPTKPVFLTDEQLATNEVDNQTKQHGLKRPEIGNFLQSSTNRLMKNV